MPRALLVLAAVAGLLPAAEAQPLRVNVAGREAAFVLQEANVAAPLVVVLAGAQDAAALQSLTKKNWNFAVPQTACLGDWGVKALEAIVAEAVKYPKVLTDRVYLVAAGEFAWMAFYAASRSPALFAATVAVAGSPKPAMDSNRLFAGNSMNTPVYWVRPAGPGALQDLLLSRLRAANFRVQTVATLDEAMEKAQHQALDAFPVMADCESGNMAFGRCFWVEITALDAAKRNDAFASSRVNPGSGASLSIGPFGYDAGASGPGVVVGWLPESYKGPLQRDDRILAVDGKPVEDGLAYLRLMDEFRDEKSVSVMVQRGKDRKRIEARIQLPKREELVTGRAQGQYLADSKEILLGSRGVGRLRVYVPPQWAGSSINWNGETVGTAGKEGCWSLGPDGLHGCDQR